MSNTANQQNAQKVLQDHPAFLTQVERKLAGVPKLHPHTCRHTFSVRYLVHGGDAFSLQRILGHTSLEMTRKYVNLASGDVKEKHRKFSPMDNLGSRAKWRGCPRGSHNRDH